MIVNNWNNFNDIAIGIYRAQQSTAHTKKHTSFPFNLIEDYEETRRGEKREVDRQNLIINCVKFEQFS